MCSQKSTKSEAQCKISQSSGFLTYHCNAHNRADLRKSTSVWNMTPCRLIERYLLFDKTVATNKVDMETAFSSEKQVNFYQITRHHL
jgi:hypothetical protein